MVERCEMRTYLLSTSWITTMIMGCNLPPTQAHNNYNRRSEQLPEAFLGQKI